MLPAIYVVSVSQIFPNTSSSLWFCFCFFKLLGIELRLLAVVGLYSIDT